MISIVVTPRCGGLTRLLYRILSRCREVVCVTDKEILAPCAQPDILLAESDVPLECGGETLYVLGTALKTDPGFIPGPRAVAVIHSQNAQALAFAAEHHLKTLTCGLSSRDTLTLSSLTEESAVVCLQRTITIIGGGVIEPSEFPMKLQGPVERRDLLTLAAVMMLCGDMERLSGPL